jgi:hypothetical protein
MDIYSQEKKGIIARTLSASFSLLILALSPLKQREKEQLATYESHKSIAQTSSFQEESACEVRIHSPTRQENA